MPRNINAGCGRALIVTVFFILSGVAGTDASAGAIVADFEANEFGQFVSEYEESGIMFTSDGGPGLSFFESLATGDMGLFEASAFGPVGVNAVLPFLAESVKVSFFLAHDDVVTLTAYDSIGEVIDVISAAGPPTPQAYLTLTVDAPAFSIARIHWIGSSDTILVAGEVSANVVPAPGALAVLALAMARTRRRR